MAARMRIAQRSGDEIGKAALERGRAHSDFRPSLKCDGRPMTVTLAVGFELFKHGGHVGRRRLLAHVAASKGEIGLEHARHFIDVFGHGLDLGTVAEEGQLKLEARENGTQIVRHAGQHGCTLLDGALDAALHFQKRRGGAADFARAARTEIRHLAALAESFRRVRQAHDRPDLITQEKDGDREHDE